MLMLGLHSNAWIDQMIAAVPGWVIAFCGQVWQDLGILFSLMKLACCQKASAILNAAQQGKCGSLLFMVKYGKIVTVHSF